MGCFSWLDCKNPKKAVKQGDTAFFLVPKEFAYIYGESGRIKEDYYDCYGHFGSYDVYELVALINRDHLSVANLRRPDPKERYGGLWEFQKDELRKQGLTEAQIAEKDEEERELNYQKGVNRHLYSVRRLRDFIEKKKSFKQMTEEYGDFLREIGIDIACYDDQNRALYHPIKITHDANAVYEDCEPSDGDPNQGC